MLFVKRRHGLLEPTIANGIQDGGLFTFTADMDRPAIATALNHLGQFRVRKECLTGLIDGIELVLVGDRCVDVSRLQRQFTLSRPAGTHTAKDGGMTGFADYFAKAR